MATGSAAVKSAASAEQALLKIASATAQKLPKLQGRQITVKTSMTYIKKFATAKKFAWEPTGLYEAVTAIRKGAGQAYGDLVDQGNKYIIDDSQNHSELAEFLQDISDQITADLQLDKADTVVEATAKLIAGATSKTFEELRLDMHRCIEKPGSRL